MRLRNWIFSVNGERLFLKGANQGPTRMALAEATADRARARRARWRVDAGLDFLRVHAHVTRPELYDAADEAGLLLWQDLPLQWGYARAMRKQAARARPARRSTCSPTTRRVRLVRPQRAAGDRHRARTAMPTRASRRLPATGVASMVLPTWNKTVLDRSIKRGAREAPTARGR